MTLNLKENSRQEGQESMWNSYLMGSKNKNKTPLYKRTSCALETHKSSNKSSEMGEECTINPYERGGSFYSISVYVGWIENGRTNTKLFFRHVFTSLQPS